MTEDAVVLPLMTVTLVVLRSAKTVATEPTAVTELIAETERTAEDGMKELPGPDPGHNLELNGQYHGLEVIIKCQSTCVTQRSMIKTLKISKTNFLFNTCCMEIETKKCNIL